MTEYYKILNEKANISPITILEIGSRDGNDAETLRSMFKIDPKNVWVVEPNPIQQNSILGRYPNVNLIKSPIFNEEKTLTFYGVNVSDQTLNGVSSLMDRVDGLYNQINTDKIELQTMLGSTLLDIIDNDIDLCKIDVEGASYEVLESFGDKINKIKSLHIECEHRSVWVNQKLYDDVSLFLTKNNFTQVYFKHCAGDTLQSDSIWVQTNFLK